jgi:putative endonuclease
MESFYVYILYSSSIGKYYVGHTHDVQKRVLQHNAGRTPSTKSGKPWILVSTEKNQTMVYGKPER